MNVASIKGRLKNISNKTGKTFQDLLIAYGLERTIYRISISKYNRRFILKGGIFFYAYSIYSVIAEKFEAFVSLGLANSRYKDFYDIYCLATAYDLDRNILKEAIAETFNHRQTQINEIGAFKDSYINNPINQRRWNSFIKKKKAINRISLNETISVIKELIMPIVDSIENNTSFNYKWSKDKRIWL